jgi:RNA polymerase sigma-70 factor (ECF subfamily)
MASIEGCSLASFSIEAERPESNAADLASLVKSYSALLFRVAHSVLRSRTEAEDVVQDVFMRVLKHHRSLHEVRDTRVWLVRIAWNLALDHKKRIRPDQMDEIFAQSLVASSLPADEALEQAQRMTAVLREMERLPKAERHILLLSAIEELSTIEIAEILGRTDSATRALLFRARTRLRERLESRLESGLGERGGKR